MVSGCRRSFLLIVLCLTLRLTSCGYPVRLVRVEIGSPVVLPCEPKIVADVMWEFVTTDNNSPIELASGGIVIDDHAKRFTLVSTSRGLYNLRIDKAQMSDAGMYVCTEDNGAASSKHYVILFVNGTGFKPQTIVVGSGSPAVLPCEPETGMDVMWEFEDTSGHLAIELASDGAIIKRHDERLTLSSSANGNQNLLINNTESRDAGLYICTEHNGAGRKHYVILKVVGAGKNKKSPNSIYPTGLDSQTDADATSQPLTAVGNVADGNISVSASMALIIALGIVAAIFTPAAVIAIAVLLRSRRKRSLKRQNSSRRNEPLSCKDFLFCKLTDELYGMMLMKAATLMYAKHQKERTDDADSFTVTTIASIHPKWRSTVETREFRQKLAKNFNHLSFPCPRRLFDEEHLDVENNDVTSFTILGDYIYTVRGLQRREWQVFDRIDYKKLHTQTLSQVMHPTCFVGNRTNDCLYLGDSIGQCIWTITPWKPGSTCELKKFYDVPAPGHSVKSLAAADDSRLIVLIAVEEYCGKTWTGKIDILDRNGKRLSRIHILEDIVNPSCVAFSRNNTFAISGVKQIWLLGEDGRKLSNCSTCSEGIVFPCSMLFNPDKHTLFVADSGSGKVLLLAICGEKLVLRKLVKKWDEWRTIPANSSYIGQSFVGDDANASDSERDSMLLSEDDNRATVNDRFNVRKVPEVKFVVGRVPDDGDQVKLMYNRPGVDVPQDVARDVERYQKRPVRVVSDRDKLIVGLNSGEILAYRLR